MSESSAPSDTHSVAAPPRLLVQVHETIRRRYYSRRTEEAYVHWIRRFIYFHQKRHPASMGEAEVTAFLNHLALDRRVAASTQNQALSALLFLYKEVLGCELPWLDGLRRPTRPPRLPTVLTHAEVERLLAQLQGTRWLVASLLYGAGLRVMECVRLRVKDVDLSYRQILVRDGKGERDRVTMLPGTWSSRFAPISSMCVYCIREIYESVMARCSSRTRWPASTRAPAPSGAGSTSFHRTIDRRTPRAARSADTISMFRSHSVQ